MSDTYSDGQGSGVVQEKAEGFSGSTVKLVGIITMFLDHFAAALLARILIAYNWSDRLYLIYTFLRIVGRLGFPIFCFLLVEGFAKTRSKVKYAIRLGVFAMISEVPFDLAFNGTMLEFFYQNVYFTLFIGLLALCAYDLISKLRAPMVLQWLFSAVGAILFAVWLKENPLKQIGFESEMMEWISLGGISLCVFALLCLYGWRTNWQKMGSAGADLAVLTLCMSLADYLRTDYSGMGVLTITVIYILRRSNALAMMGGCAVLTLMSLSELSAFFALIPVSQYNGKRGLKLKYFFYAFYPVHLFLLWLVAHWMGIGHIPVV